MPNKQTQRLGEHQEIHIGKFKADRFGVVSGTAERHRPEDFDAPDWQYLLPSNAPVVIPGLACIGVERDYDERNAHGIYRYSYDGISDQDVSFEERVFCSLEGTDSEEPIETHPAFKALFTKYRGVYVPGTKRFDYFQPTLTTGIQGPSRTGAPLEDEKNPLYGVTHFLTVGLVWTRTYVTRNLPNDLLERVDCIDTPKGHGAMNPPNLGGKRNWLKIAPAAAERGSIIQVSDRWLASGKNGFNKDIYGERHAAGAK